MFSESTCWVLGLSLLLSSSAQRRQCVFVCTYTHTHLYLYFYVHVYRRHTFTLECQIPINTTGVILVFSLSTFVTPFADSEKSVFLINNYCIEFDPYHQHMYLVLNLLSLEALICRLCPATYMPLSRTRTLHMGPPPQWGTWGPPWPAWLWCSLAVALPTRTARTPQLRTWAPAGPPPPGTPSTPSGLCCPPWGCGQPLLRGRSAGTLHPAQPQGHPGSPYPSPQRPHLPHPALPNDFL